MTEQLSVEHRLLALAVVEAYREGRTHDADALLATSEPLEVLIGFVQITGGLLAQIAADNGTTASDVVSIYRHGLMQAAE